MDFRSSHFNKDSVAKRYASQNLSNENEKKYIEHINQVEHSNFTCLVTEAAAGIAWERLQFDSRVSNMISIKRSMISTIAW